jgi:Uma2 family endonuclease
LPDATPGVPPNDQVTNSIPPPIALSEYLHTRFEPDCDYVDGILEKRSVGGPDHAAAQRALLAWISQRAREWGVRAEPEVRVQTSASHVRVADVALIADEEAGGDVIEKPPVAVIEILSPEDNVSRATERLDDYLRMGVKSIWVIDPAARKGFDASGEQWVETERFTAPESPIAVDPAAIFAEMDQGRAR